MATTTIVPESFHAASYQATLFTPEEEISASKLVSSLLPRWAARFDGDPVILPAAAEGLPREIPKIILSSTSGTWRCEIASARINLFWRRTKTVTIALTPSAAAFYSDAASLLNEYSAVVKARVGRMAAVVNRYASHPEPGIFLAGHFCQDRWLKAPLNRPEHFELHAHKRFMMAGQFTVNSWVRNKTGRMDVEGSPTPIVLVEQDINTIPEDSERRSFESGEITRFFEATAREIDVVLALYYPTPVRS
jgi:hypothetical protein